MAQDPDKIVPKRQSDDNAVLAAWYYGADTLFGHYRKVMLAACKESIRASVTAAGAKMTEGKLDDLAHLHTAYLSFLADHLTGRTEWMASFQREGGMKP